VTAVIKGAGAVLLGLALFGCAGPMGQREAENRAGRSLTEFCAGAACGQAKLLKAQKIKDRWLVDFETANGLYTVAVNQRTGQTNVSVWDKNPAR
jgi:hypothetical protein